MPGARILCPTCDGQHEPPADMVISDGGLTEWRCPGCGERFEIMTDFCEVEAAEEDGTEE